MKTLLCLPAALALVALGTASRVVAAPEYPKMGADIYDTQADGTSQIAEAVKTASAEHKRVLVDFGANWCIWCRRLHSTFETNPAVAKALHDNFVVVLVDVNGRRGVKRNAEVNARYGNPVQHGLPVLVVLDSDGKQLTTKDSGELEEGEGHSPAKITAFLSVWTPPAQ